MFTQKDAPARLEQLLKMVNHRFMVLFRSSTVAWLLATLLGLTAVSPCCAQGKPRPPDRGAISNKGPLTPEQLATLTTFAEFWCAQLSSKTSTPEQVQEARTELVRPLAPINDPQPPFRVEYSSILMKCLKPAITGGSLHTAANGVALVTQLGTRGSLNLLLDSSTNPQIPWQTRQAAAQGGVIAVKAPGLQAKEILDAVRRMRDSLRDDDNALIVRYRFEAILAAADNPVLALADRNKILSSDLPDAVNAVVGRIKQHVQVPSAMFGSLYLAVWRVFNLHINGKLSPQVAQAIGAKIGPDLVEALDIARQQWETAHADPEMAREYSSFIKSSEDLLKRLDPEVRRDVQQRPQTQLQVAWTEKKKDQFDADTKKWQEVVSQPPYAKK